MTVNKKEDLLQQQPMPQQPQPQVLPPQPVATPIVSRE